MYPNMFRIIQILAYSVHVSGEKMTIAQSAYDETLLNVLILNLINIILIINSFRLNRNVIEKVYLILSSYIYIDHQSFKQNLQLYIALA